MNKHYLPAIASLLIIAITLTSFTPIFAALPTMPVAQPTLRVTTIAEDDELRQTGIMWMGLGVGLGSVTGGTGVTSFGAAQFQFDGQLVINDLLAQFKILISYNGVPVTPDSITCQFVEKDKANPLKDQQFAAENLKSVPKENPNFVCKFREGKPGVGVLDVYYIGDLLPQYIADYILVVGASLAVGRTTVFGTEIQDICLLGFPLEIAIIREDGSIQVIVPDALGPYESCEDAALFERQELFDIPIPWT